MDMRAEVWSPVQNVSVWLGAWLWGHESTDGFLDALSELGGEQQGVDGEPFVDVMSLLRRETASVIKRGEREPLLRLVLSGPGDAPALPAGTESARAAAENPAGAIVVRTNNRDRNLVLVPIFKGSYGVFRNELIIHRGRVAGIEVNELAGPPHHGLARAHQIGKVFLTQVLHRGAPGQGQAVD